MHLTVYQIDAFTRRPLAGNAAAIIPLDSWLEPGLMQAMAAEHNLAETAFLVGSGGRYRLRWFAPLTEVDFCGHATLAAAWVVLEQLEPARDSVQFETRAGRLSVHRTGDGLLMDFPRRAHTPCPAPPGLSDALGIEPQHVLEGDDVIAVLGSESAVASVTPDLEKLKQLPGRAVVVTAPGESVDFVSRVFGPKVGIGEDPVTGSTHCALAPYWGGRLDRSSLRARQLSRRGGELICRLVGDRVHIIGHCAQYMVGSIALEG